MPNPFHSLASTRYTGNYYNMVDGPGMHVDHITFHDFLEKPEESAFIFDDSFFTIPRYIRDQVSNAPEINDIARISVLEYIVSEFAELQLSQQNYVEWGRRFKNRCLAVAPGFWSQVNLFSFMTAVDLEFDNNTFERLGTGTATRLGGQTTEQQSAGTSKTDSEGTSKQDTDVTQPDNAFSRTGNATTVRAGDVVSDDLKYAWDEAIDGIQETITNAGSSHTHSEGETSATSTTNTDNTTTSVTSMNNSQDVNETTGRDTQQLTNKMYSYELPRLIEVAQSFMPLQWLYIQLRPMFSCLY